ncbi:lysozyme inhibitor LprI family protein [Roseovarius aquimarinus]|uniref:lysozyme inhibitor LprI family protein n=1 Tax=Roseovarius aquimarinus TaxID=1229156 RepID=UPI003636CA89
MDCTEPSSSAEEAVCSDPGLAEVDRELQRTYRAALIGLEDDQASGSRAEQRGWIKSCDEC